MQERTNKELVCYVCGKPRSRKHFKKVDAVLEQLPVDLFTLVSEQYTHLSGDDELFHDGIMNQCEQCLKMDIARFFSRGKG